MKHRAVAAWALATLLAGCASTVVPRWPDGAASDAAANETAAADATDALPPPPSDAGTGPCILPSNGMPCAVGSTCSDGFCGSCTCARSDLLLCAEPHSCPIVTLCMHDSQCAVLGPGSTCQFPTNYCGTHGTCGTPGMCAGGQTYCGCNGESYIPANGRCEPDRPTVHAGPCVGPPPPSCTLPSGAACPANTSCPAGDGCNTCFCGNDGTATCSTTGCRMNPARVCVAATQCNTGETCQFYTLGCGSLGQCVPRVSCSETTAFCGCHGTYTDCVMTQPTLQPGSCG